MELSLPMNYVELNQEEMMYLDGGWWSESRWYGAAIYMSQGESKELQANLDLAALTGNFGIGLLASFVTGAFAVWGVFTLYADLLSSRLNYHTTSRGVILNMTPAAVFWCEGR